MPIEMLSGFTANISMETQIQQNRRYTTIQLDIIHTGDCLEILKTLPDDSVHCCVTSPPYYALRDYGMEAQIGRETTPKEYISRLTEVFTDVFLSKDGETFKELKATDYIPVGATLNVDGIKCRIDAVDFAADEVRLTNIEDKNRPIRFSESIQYVRAYVEDAGTAIYDAIPKKPAARESIRDKLKSAQKAQPPHTPKPQKSKGKDMEL